MSTEPLKIFYSYAHADESLLNRLNEHLAGMQRQGLISTWNSQNIAAGGIRVISGERQAEKTTSMCVLVVEVL